MPRPRDWGITRPNDLDEHLERDDVTRVLNVIDWKWVAGVLIAMCVWGVNQWIQYNALTKSFSDLSARVVELTATVSSLNVQLNSSSTENLKQDFAISRLKERIDSLEAKDNQRK